MSRMLEVGDAAPEVTGTDHAGKPLRLSDLRGRPVVVFFYPKDHTPACTAQACGFRDAYEDFAAAGAEVIGISTGSEGTHAGFASRHRLPFRLVADDGSIRRAFGVPRTLGLFPGRVTFVLDAQGVVRHTFNSQLRVGQHIRQALEVVRQLAGAGGAGGVSSGA